MKIAHISDIHWRGISRHDEYTQAFEDLYRKLRDEIKPDVIVNTGDTFHTKTQGITPEIIERLSWMIRELANIAPSYTLLGNHDGNLTNPDRKDVITPIHEAVDHKQAILLRDSGVYSVTPEVDFYAFSPFDKTGWEDLKPNPEKISIALFHGTMTGCVMDNNWAMPTGECKASDFTGYDFVLMGDIHKRQAMAYRLDENGIEKPWIAYAGSFIQQNFGESEQKGIQVWDIRSKGDWDVTYVPMPNHKPFISIDWNNSAEETLQDIISDRGGLRSDIKPGSRFRIISNQPIAESQERKLLTDLKEEFLASDVVYKSDYSTSMEEINTDSLTLSKKSLRDDPESLFYLYEEYLKANTTETNFPIEGEVLEEAKKNIEKYLTDFNNSTPEAAHASIWSLKWIEFDNIFCYGEKNRVDLRNLDGLVGLFGPNRAGKSSVVAAISYALFNASDRGSIKNIDMINKNKKYCSAKVRFSVNGDDYIVERKTKRSYDKQGVETGKVVNTVDLCQIVRLEDGSEIRKGKNSISTTDTDKEIRRLIGGQEDFLLTGFAAQGNLNRFINEGATNRKKHLGRFLELDIFEKLHNMVKEDLSSINKKGVFLSEEEWKQRIDFNENQTEVARQRVVDLYELKKPLQEERDQLKLWLFQHENDSSRIDNQELMKIEEKCFDLTEKLSLKTSELDSFVKVRKNKETLLKKLDKELLSFNEEWLLEQKAHLNTLATMISSKTLDLDKNNESLKRLEKSVKILETVPCGDSFPSCRFIKNSYEDKSKLDLQKKNVEDLVEKLKKFEKESSAIVKNKINEKLDRLNQCKNEKNQIKHDLLVFNEKISKTETQIESLENTLGLMNETLNEMQKKAFIMDSEEYTSKQKELIDLEETMNKIEEEISINNQEIGKINERVKILLRERDESVHLYQKIGVLSSIQDAFSKRGIPSMVLKTQLPAINKEISKFLTSVVDFKVTLESNTSSNAMDVFITDTNGKRTIELCSGMEKTLCAIAIRVALINLTSLPRSNFFIIDEGFGALDKDNQQSCMDMLLMLSSYFRTVLIISHVEQVKEVANKIIEIKQTKNGSKISA